MAAELWAVQGDECDHGQGQFKEPSRKNTVFINNQPVICRNDEAYPDQAGHIEDFAEGASSSVYAYNMAAHRNNDGRRCGAKTKVDMQTTVFAG